MPTNYEIPKFNVIEKNPIKQVISSVGKANSDVNNLIGKITNTVEDLTGGLIPYKINTNLSQLIIENTVPLIYRSRMTVREGDTFNIKSKLGTPVVDRLIFTLTPAQLGRSVTVPPGTPTVVPAPTAGVPEILNFGGQFTFNPAPPLSLDFDDVLITVSETKNIVRTQIAGNNGTVKEMIGLDDYVINITGRFTGEYNKRDRTALVLLKDFCESEAVIKCSSNYLQDLGILELVITDYDLPQIEGEYSTQYFTLNAISDTKVENQFINFIF